MSDAPGLNQVTRLDGPVLGLLTGGNMTAEWGGPQATLGEGLPAQRCNEQNRPADQPSLAAMTRKAIQLLSRRNRRGFFLQVEGASIDKQDHAVRPDRRDRRLRRGDRRGARLPARAPRHARGRHRRSRGHEPDRGRGHHGHREPTGYSGNLVTRDGQTMRLTYGTAREGSSPVIPPPSQQHTGAIVPVWGSGPTAKNVLGANDHTDLFGLLNGDG